MFLAFLFCILIILAVCGLCFLLFIYFRFNPEMVFSKEEKDFLNDLVEPAAGNDTGLCAVVKCSPDRNANKKLLEHREMTDCRLFSEIYGKELFCKWGCIGYGTCVTFCPQHAIIIKNGTAVVTESCNGCGECLPPIILLLSKYIAGGFAFSWINPAVISVLALFLLKSSLFPDFLIPHEYLKNENIFSNLISDGTFSVLPADKAITSFLNKYVFKFTGLVLPEGYISGARFIAPFLVQFAHCSLSTPLSSTPAEDTASQKLC